MIFKDILLELRAIRIGLELQLKAVTGVDMSLVQIAEVDEAHAKIKDHVQRRPPRGPDALIHRHAEHLTRQQRLREAGDDTERMIKEIETTYGSEKAQQLREFYEKEILGKS